MHNHKNFICLEEKKGKAIIETSQETYFCFMGTDLLAPRRVGKVETVDEFATVVTGAEHTRKTRGKG